MRGTKFWSVVVGVTLGGCGVNATVSPPVAGDPLMPEGTRLLTELRARTVPAAAQSVQEKCYADEERYLAVADALVTPWRHAWEARDTAAFASLTAPGFEARGLATTLPVASRTVGGVAEHPWAAGTSGTVASWLGQFGTVEDVKLDVFNVRVVGERDASGGYADAELTVRFDVRGLDTEGWRRNDRGELRARAVRQGDAWKLTRIEATSGETLRAEKPLFTDATVALGAENVPVYTRIEAIRRGGYAIALSDYDNDGHADMYVGTWGPGVLLHGRGDGGFEPAPASGLDEETLVKTAMFADFDRDGWDDLFLVRFTPSGDGKEDLAYYRNDGTGKFARVATPFTGRVPAGHAMPAAVADFNNDGALDVYVGYPGSRDFTVLGDAAPGELAVQGLLLNDGKGGFTDTTRMAFAGHQPTTLYAHSVLSADYDQDGDADLVVIDDRGGLSPVYQNQGDGTFAQVAQDIGVGNAGWGMGVATADYDNDGLLDFAMTNVDFVAGHRLRSACDTNYGHHLNYTEQKGLRLFHNLGAGRFEEVTGKAGLAWAGEGSAGAEFVDYDNDGLADLYLANGLWSGTTEDQDLSSWFIRAFADKAGWGEMVALLSYQREKDAELGNWDSTKADLDAHRMESQSPFMRILGLYQGDLRDPAAAGDARPSMGGYQRNRLFRNNGDGTFTDVGYLAGADTENDGYVIAKADLNDDGRVDLVLRNCDPGTTAHTFAPVQVLLNQGDAGNSLVLRLEGTASNPDAIGAQVTAKVGGEVRYSQVIGNNGTAQSEKFVHLGLGSAAKADEVQIRWPSGETQVLRNVGAGSHVIREPSSAVADEG